MRLPRSGSAFVGVLVIGTLAVFGSAYAAASTSAPAAQAIVRALNLQTDLPGPRIEHDQTFHWSGSLPLGDLWLAIATGAVIVALLFATWTIRDRLPAFGRPRLAAAEPANTAVSVENMVASQLEADELARGGRIVEAMHTLLLRSLIEMRKTLDIGIPDSLTSREILGRVSLSDLGREALGDVIQRVELVYFGDRPADQGSYAACRQSYLALIAAIRGGLARAPRG